MQNNYGLGARPRNPNARVNGYLVKFTANEHDDPVTDSEAAWAIIGRIIKDEFEARAFYASLLDTPAAPVWHGAGEWRFDPVRGDYTDGNRPGVQF